MDNHKRCTLQVEVPRKQPELKDLLFDACIQGIREAARALANSLSSNDDSSRSIGLTIDVPKIKIPTSAPDYDVDSVTDEVSQETMEDDE
jgi:hypothetical protein|tara:strand:+ start:15786 stop:16055 length:270 start_codon:yes stop_codon:yes gene_type:complete